MPGSPCRASLLRQSQHRPLRFHSSETNADWYSLKKRSHFCSWSISSFLWRDVVFNGLARQIRLLGLDDAKMPGRNHEKDKLLSTPSALQAKDLEREIKGSGEREARRRGAANLTGAIVERDDLTAGFRNGQPEAPNSAGRHRIEAASTPNLMADGQGAHALDELP